MITASSIIAACGMLIPPAVLAAVRGRLFKEHRSPSHYAFAYAASFFTVNWTVILFIYYARNYYKSKVTMDKLLFSTLTVALKYLALATVLAVALPLLEYGALRVLRRLRTAPGGRIRLSVENTWRNKGALHIALQVLLHLALLTLLIASFSIPWTKIKFDTVTLNEILYTLSMPLDGASNEFMYSFINLVIIPACVLFGIKLYNLLKYGEKYRVTISRENGGGSGKSRVLYPARLRWLALALALWFAAALYFADKNFDIRGYIRDQSDKSTIYEEEFVSPRDVKLTFPAKKRNLIYIIIESGESSFQNKANGGLLDRNCIPELTQLAEENVSFSRNDALTGAQVTPKCGYTIGGITAETAGVPMALNNFGQRYAYFMPKVTGLGDILEEEGYHNYFMCGSDLSFAGKNKYFIQHGNYEYFDYNSAIEEGKIDQDYKVWWGYEDQKLYQYAKEKLTMLASEDRPFNFTMLTVDTHHPEGYVCDLCEEVTGQQYTDVYACSSKQLYGFVRWIQEQDFYENTTVVLCGDHFSMNARIFANVDRTNRGVYNCFINSAVQPVEQKNRMFTTLDIFPTTLASLGVKIEGERLGLGTNLFSDEPTLAEKLGYGKFSDEIRKQSDFYDNNIIR